MRIVLPLILFATVFVGVPTVLSQSRSITEAELNQLVAAATEKRKGLPQRHTIKTLGYTDGDWSETLAEYGTNDSYRYVVVQRSRGMETKSEGIHIGDVRYTRQKDGSWIKEPPTRDTGGGGGLGGGSGTITKAAEPETSTDYVYLGREKVNGMQTEHYRKTHVVRFTSRTPASVRRIVDDYWFGEDGLLVKESQEDVFENSKERYKIVTEYEYDSDIKITAPIPD